MIKRITVFLLILSFLFAGMPALAAQEESLTLRVVGDTVEIKGELPNSRTGEPALILILSEGGSLSEIEIKDGTLTSLIVHMDEAILDADKKINKTIKMGPEHATGTYQLILKLNSAQILTRTFYFVQPEEIRQPLALINQLKITDANFKENMIAVLRENENILGLDLTDFLKDAFHARQDSVLLGIKSVQYNLADYIDSLLKLRELFAKELLRNLVELAESETELDQYITRYQDDTNHSFDGYQLIKSKNLLSAYFAYLKPKTFTDIGEFFIELKLAEFFTRFNHAQRNEMKEIFQEYNETYLKIDTSRFPKVDVNALFQELSKKEYTSISALETDIGQIIDGLLNSKPTGGGPGNSGGSISYAPVATQEPDRGKEVAIGEIFTDLKSVAWAQESVKRLVEKAVVSRNGEKKFRPNDSITREEFVKLLISAFYKVDPTAAASFQDVEKETWYYAYVATAAQKGLVKGVSETRFGIGNPITREEIAALAYRVMTDLNFGALPEMNEKQFTDDEAISDYARDSIKSMSKSGIINGFEDGSFRPGHLATRAESAVIICRILDLKS